MLPQKCTVFASASQRQERNNRPTAAALFAANIHDKYRRRFVLANTFQQTKTLFDKAHVRCIMHDIGITSCGNNSASNRDSNLTVYSAVFKLPLRSCILRRLLVTFQITMQIIFVSATFAITIHSKVDMESCNLKI